MNRFVFTLCNFLVLIAAAKSSLVDCELCNAGQYMEKECSAKNATVCKDCPLGHFTSKKNKDNKCQKCLRTCHGKQIQVVACSRTTNMKCECPADTFYVEDHMFCENCYTCPDGFVIEKPCNRLSNTICKKQPSGFVPVRSTTPMAIITSLEHTEHTELPPPTKTVIDATAIKEYVYIHEAPVYKVLVVVFGFLLIVVAVVLIYKKMLKCRTFSHISLASPEGSDVSLLWIGDLKLKLRDVPASIIQDLAELLNPSSARDWIHLAGRLGYTQQQVANYKLQPKEATQSLLQDWGTREGSTVRQLFHELNAMGRSDAARMLYSKGTPV